MQTAYAGRCAWKEQNWMAVDAGIVKIREEGVYQEKLNAECRMQNVE